MFIHCRNSKCQNYWEDSCTLNLEEKMVCFNEEGKCESFKEGFSEYYEKEFREFQENTINEISTAFGIPRKYFTRGGE